MGVPGSAGRGIWALPFPSCPSRRNGPARGTCWRGGRRVGSEGCEGCGSSPVPCARCPPGCYPRCPEDRPIYDEDLKKCVRSDQCGCYVEDTHYPPGASVPPKHDCQAWYVSSHPRGPGGGRHTHWPRAHPCTCLHEGARAQAALLVLASRAALPASPHPPPALCRGPGGSGLHRARDSQVPGLQPALALQRVYELLASLLAGGR